jgi:EAL domain-containing protein (putative c-di-GMP-specific phosphodiesterase class I)/CheY-like chemotaxis protein
MQNNINNKKRILLVDDEKNLTQMLCMLLETRGYLVEIAYTASEAFHKISPEIDLIILDIVLPDLDGFQVCQRLKENETTRHIPIIMLSAHALHEDKLEGLYLGADDFLLKPCEYEELLARMEVVMRRNGHNGNGNGNGGTENLVRELRKILDEALIVPFYQPIYLLEPLRLYGVEILSRPTTSTSLIHPEVLFKAALDYGMYTDMELLGWSLALPPLGKTIKTEKVFLNCNPYFFETPQFLRVCALLEKNKIAPGQVILEITERSEITNFDLFYEQLNRYRDAGFKFAIDDVGGGYASLEAIVEIKPDVVKINRQIIVDLGKDPFKQSIVKFISGLCKEHAILSIAEGVETKDELDLVQGLGIDAVQGFYLYKPTPKIDFDGFNQIKQH